MTGGEFDLIRKIRELVNSRQVFPGGITGIGDDCAVYRISEGRYGLFSTDMSIENIHFDFSYCTYYDAGYRSMAANISDIRAMGGRPLMAFISAGIPLSTEDEMVIKAYDGMIDCAAKHGVLIAGGDTVSAEKFILGISIYGETELPVMRNGAMPGDCIYLTGSAGGSMLGMLLLQSGADRSQYPESIAKHLRPDAYTGIDRIITDYSPTSMIDVSDGLLSDLGHICEESQCGFELRADQIPIPAEVSRYCGLNAADPLQYSLRSGEEYELIFTSKKSSHGPEVFPIGRITASGKFIIINGIRTEIETSGFDHFSGRS